MRIIFEKNLQRFHVQINERSRDDTPRLQSGLEALYCDEKSRQAVVGHMEAKHSERASLENGRPGTSFRQVLAPGIFKQGVSLLKLTYHGVDFSCSTWSGRSYFNPSLSYAETSRS